MFGAEGVEYAGFIRGQQKNAVDQISCEGDGDEDLHGPTACPPAAGPCMPTLSSFMAHAAQN